LQRAFSSLSTLQKLHIYFTLMAICLSAENRALSAAGFVDRNH